MSKSKIVRELVYGLLLVGILISVFLFYYRIVSAKTNIHSNIDEQNYGPNGWGNWPGTSKSFIIETFDNKIMIFQANDDENYLVKYYDKSFKELSSKEIAKELNLFGSFYYDGNNYYILSGQENYEEKSSVECFRITKYDVNWKRISSIGLYDCNTVEPFYGGNARMAKAGKYLLIKTCHKMYMRAYDTCNHQANVMIQVDTETMNITQSHTSMSGGGYASHSFDQYILVDDNKLVALDLCDGVPSRGIRLLLGSKDLRNGTFHESGGGYEKKEIENGQVVGYDFGYLLSFDGEYGENYTGASIGGFEFSDSSYLTVGNSVTIKNNKNVFIEPYYSEEEGCILYDTSNVFISVYDKNTKQDKRIMLTNYPFGDEGASTPQLVKINENKFVVLWCRDEIVYYTYIDGKGNILTDTYSMPGFLTDCQPIVVDNNIVWFEYYGNTESRTQYVFNSIPINTCSGNHSWDEKKTTWLHWEYMHDNKLLSVKTCQKCNVTDTTIVSTCSFHSWNEGTIIKKATCKEEGKIKYTCKNCGYKETKLIYKTSYHNWDDGVITQKPTKDEYGIKTIKCKDCGTITTEYIQPISINDESVELFVRRIYSDCLGRTPEEDGVKYWSNELTSGNRDGASVGAGFVFSEEYMSKGVSKKEYVKMLYKVFMGREADDGGMNYWLDNMKKGMTREEVFKGFVDSPEYTQICADYGIKRGNYTIQGIPDPVIKNGVVTPEITSFVERIYVKALNRQSDPNGIAYWSQEIANETKDPVAVAELFIFSEEFESKNLNDIEYVKVLYRTFMGREYDDAGLNYWLGNLTNGTSRKEVLESFAGCPEFQDIIKSFGL